VVPQNSHHAKNVTISLYEIVTTLSIAMMQMATIATAGHEIIFETHASLAPKAVHTGLHRQLLIILRLTCKVEMDDALQLSVQRVDSNGRSSLSVLNSWHTMSLAAGLNLHVCTQGCSCECQAIKTIREGKLEDKIWVEVVKFQSPTTAIYQRILRLVFCTTISNVLKMIVWL